MPWQCSLLGLIQMSAPAGLSFIQARIPTESMAVWAELGWSFTAPCPGALTRMLGGYAPCGSACIDPLQIQEKAAKATG